MTKIPHVVIIGGGFGGLYAAKRLAKQSVRVTLIDRRNDPVGLSRTDTDLASMRGAVTTPIEGDAGANVTAPEQGSSGTEEGALEPEQPEGPSAEELAFVRSNELAELKQTRAAERNRARRDSLDRRIADLERSLRESATASTAAGANQQQGTEAPASSGSVVSSASCRGPCPSSTAKAPR